MQNVLLPANTQLPAVIQTQRGLAGIALDENAVKGGAIGAVHETLIQELRQPALSWYLAGISNRQTRRAVGAIRRSAKAHRAAYRGALAAVRKPAASFSILPITIKGAQAVKQRAAGVYSTLKSKFTAFRRQQG